ncbi:MAG: ABC transporter permease [Candidatus Acidiferrales bacterium]|jgi:lipopolysaccharide transport system permease protein
MSATPSIAQGQPTPDEFAGSNVLWIEPIEGWTTLKLKELWEYRELLYFLVWRDIKVRYKQAALGAAWAILQPLLTMLIFSLFFGRLAKVPSDGIPYPLFSFTALVPWNFFATAIAQSSNSVVGSSNLITKVYFPRLAIPLASVLAGLMDFAISGGVLLVMMAYYRRVPTAHILWLPFFVLLALAAAVGVGFWLSALNVKFRDVRYVVPFLVQFWMFASPIVYPTSLLPARWRTLYALNPMVGVVDGFRWALLGTHTAPGPIIAASVLATLAFVIGGALYFRRMEAQFADVV